MAVRKYYLSVSSLWKVHFLFTFYLWFCLWFKGFLGKLTSWLRDWWPLVTKLGLWHLLTLFERKTKKYTPLLEVYLFHPRISQHLTSSRLFRRKARKPRVLRLNPNSQSVGHWGRDSNLCSRKRRLPPPSPKGFQWMTLQKPPLRVPISTQRHGHSKSNYLDATVTEQSKERGRNKFKSWLYHLGCFQHLTCQSMFPRSIRQSSTKSQSFHEDHCGGCGEGAWNTLFANYKVLHTYKALVHIEISSSFLGFLESAKVCFMILLDTMLGL